MSNDTGYWFMNCGENKTNNGRAWEDCVKYGVILAGGGPSYVRAAKKLNPGDKVFVYLNGHGYVGLGEVVDEAVPFLWFVPDDQNTRLPKLPLVAKLDDKEYPNRDDREWCVKVKWHRAVPRNEAVLQNRFRRATLSRIRQQDLVDELLTHFDPPSRAAA